MKRKIMLVSGLILLSVGGCTAGQHAQSVRATQDGDRVSVGTVQREIRVGMTNAEVIEVLGSPNIVTTDALRREVWVYDKIATESVRSSSSGGLAALIFGPISSAGGGVLASGKVSSGAASTSQRTFTVIIKYDENSRVRDFAYNTTRF